MEGTIANNFQISLSSQYYSKWDIDDVYKTVKQLAYIQDN